jgi:hypothetical protein
MSRALIEDLLENDSALAGLGIDSESVFNQHDIKERPRDDGPFVVIRWEESTIFNQSYTGMTNGLARAPRMLSLWVHSPMEISTDFEHIDKILDRIDTVFEMVEDVPGSDGYTVTTIRNSGRSADMNDEGFMTITRNASYAVLYRRS